MAGRCLVLPGVAGRCLARPGVAWSNRRCCWCRSCFGSGERRTATLAFLSSSRCCAAAAPDSARLAPISNRRRTQRAARCALIQGPFPHFHPVKSSISGRGGGAGRGRIRRAERAPQRHPPMPKPPRPRFRSRLRPAPEPIGGLGIGALGPRRPIRAQDFPLSAVRNRAARQRGPITRRTGGDPQRGTQCHQPEWRPLAVRWSETAAVTTR